MADIQLGIVGSRRRNSMRDKELIRNLLMTRLGKGDRLHLISGGCPKGADKFAEELAEELHLEITIHLPDKSSLPAKPLYHDFVRMYHDRNTLIAEECQILVALPANDRKGGTEDTIQKAKTLGRPVVLI